MSAAADMTFVGAGGDGTEAVTGVPSALRLLGVDNGFYILGSQCLCCIVILELDDIDGCCRRAGDRRDSSRVETFITRMPFRKDRIIH